MRAFGFTVVNKLPSTKNAHSQLPMKRELLDVKAGLRNNTNAIVINTATFVVEIEIVGGNFDGCSKKFHEFHSMLARSGLLEEEGGCSTSAVPANGSPVSHHSIFYGTFE